MNTYESLVVRICAGERRAIARAISLVESRPEALEGILRLVYPHTGRAHVIGVTGPPGAGKSTLTNALARQRAQSGKKVAVLAIDPTSPYSGGAVLGDRVRMEDAVEHGHVLVRSLASRGALGGLSNAVPAAIDILDAAGFDEIFVETVGVGQGEVDVRNCAVTTIVVMVPGMGDEVQVMKAGILEIADLYVINKADRPQVHELERELRVLLSLEALDASEWKKTVTKTVATSYEGISEVSNLLEQHLLWLGQTGARAQRTRENLRQRIVRNLSSMLVARVESECQDQLQALIEQCLQRQSDPQSATQQLLQVLLKSCS